MHEILDALIRSLNQIEVKGERNLDILLGCILELKKLKGMVKTEKTVEREGDKGEDQNERGKDAGGDVDLGEQHR